MGAGFWGTATKKREVFSFQTLRALQKRGAESDTFSSLPANQGR
jgi:hypothetical protein